MSVVGGKAGMIHLSYFLPKGLRATPTTSLYADSPELLEAMPSTFPTQAQTDPSSELVENIIDSCLTG